MKVTRISKIKGYRLFRDFTWPNDLQAFGRFNLIYGWNGSGKTTLAALFRSLQDRAAVGAGEVVFDVDDNPVKGLEIPEAALPPVRVFNRDFVATTVLASEREIAPIYFLGQDSVEKQQQVEKLKKDLSRADTEFTTAKSEKAAAEKALDDFCIARAKVIKELLISSRSTTYNNYDKRCFRQAVERLDPTSKQAALLQDDEKTKLRSQKDAQPKSALASIACDLPDLAELTASTESLLKRSVASQVIDALASDREVGTWVRQGLALHTGARSTDECRFCGQTVPTARIAALEAHFNDAFARFQSKIDSLAGQVEGDKKRLAKLTLPESSRLYDYLATELDATLTTARGSIDPAVNYLGSLHAHLVAKRESPFTPQSLEALVTPDPGAISRAIMAVNEVIEKHNSTTARFQSEVDAACQKLEQCYVAEAFPEFTQLRNATTTADASVTAATDKAQSLRDQIIAVEREIEEHLRPAEELNAELHAYLGRDELRFEVKEAGYSMTRNSQPASDLSEGEKTAIAFLYFLKSLQDKSFDLANGVVVIDDPVSSLDANALFSAFGCMKERTKDTGQLFVLTHNFCFFRQVKNWFHYINKSKAPATERPLARFYLLSAIGDDETDRKAVLGPIDRLLEEFDSEYHYLFKRVMEESVRGTECIPLGDRYSMPNLARRLIETFLAFRYPDCSGNNALYAALERVDFDAGKKTRILRLVNTYSHSGRISDAEDDPWALSETGVVLRDILDLIQKEDPAHFNGMINRIQPTQVAT